MFRVHKIYNRCHLYIKIDKFFFNPLQEKSFTAVPGFFNVLLLSMPFSLAQLCGCTAVFFHHSTMEISFRQVLNSFRKISELRPYLVIIAKVWISVFKMYNCVKQEIESSVLTQPASSCK